MDIHSKKLLIILSENLCFIDQQILQVQNIKRDIWLLCISWNQQLDKFRRDLRVLAEKLSQGENDHVKKEMRRLEELLISFHKRRIVKINHSVMELVCAKYLVKSGYYVELEKVLDGVSCDVHARKGLGSLIVEIETGFVPPEQALDPSLYIRARIASKITRYNSYSEKFALAVPLHYAMPIHPALVIPPQDRTSKQIRAIKRLCDLYYSHPPVNQREIRNARIHTVYLLNIDSGTVKETEPTTYINNVQSLFR